MMLSPEQYYEDNLKGKTKEQILTVIRGLKQEIGRLKNIMESPDDAVKIMMQPSEDTQIYWSRHYLERAKKAYAEAGGTYILSKSEEKAANFHANIGAINKITFRIGGFFDGFRSYIVELSDDLNAYTKLWEEEESLNLLDDNEEPFTKDTFLAALINLHIGEWRRNYSTKRFGYMVYDGTQWELEFEYNKGHKSIRFAGDNSYPYNFNQFQRLFGIDDTEEDEMSKFDILTKYIPLIQDHSFCERVVYKDGTLKEPIQISNVNYSEILYNFIDDVYTFEERNKDMELTCYEKILEDHGLEWAEDSMKNADVSSLNAQVILALIMGAIRADRFSEGALLDFFESGCILKWLESLKSIEGKR